jgi:hypothetical protein
MKLHLSLLFSGLCLYAAAQDTTSVQPNERGGKNSFYISFGKPLFTDAFITKRNFSLALSYHYRFIRSFAIEPFYLYAQNNSYPNFFGNQAELDRYIRSMTGPNMLYATWDEVYTHSLGARLHFAIINNQRWYFSFNFASGYFSSLSSKHYLSDLLYELHFHPGLPEPDFVVTYYRTRQHSRWNNGVFIMPGLLLNYQTRNGFLFGLHLTGYFFNEREPLTLEAKPVFPNHWNASLVFGKSF